MECWLLARLIAPADNWASLPMVTKVGRLVDAHPDRATLDMSRETRSSTSHSAEWMRMWSDERSVVKLEASFRGASYDMHRHDTYAVGITTFGAQRIRYRGQDMLGHTGNTIVIYPDEPHDGRAETPDGYGYRIIHMPPGVLQQILGGTPLPFLREGASDHRELHLVAQAILREIGPTVDAMSHEDQLLELALALQAAAGSGRQHAGDLRAARVARDLIDSEPTRRLDLEVLSRASGRDRWSLSRDFRQFFGTSPSRYMTMRRLDHARRLMARGVPLVECAMAAGFADQSHMSRQFCSAFGVTPSRWVELQRYRGR